MHLELIEEYKSLTEICSRTDYGVMASVKKHNDSVDRMLEIVEEIRREQDTETTAHFTMLLDISNNNTNLWAATHILERLNTDMETEHKALGVIKKAANGDGVDAPGFRIWLDDWYKKHK